MIILGLIIFSYCYNNKVRFHFNTFLKKGFKKFDDDYGLFLFYADQGGGKTFSVIDILNHFLGKRKIITNVKSYYELHKKDVIFMNDFRKLRSFLESKEDCSDIVVFYDEIFSAISKYDLDDDLLNFFTQFRKRHLYFFSTTQLWSKLPKELRDLCRFEVSCSMFNLPILGFAVLINKFNDGYNIHWDCESNSYVAPRLWTSIKKCNYSVACSYDTFETIKHQKQVSAQALLPAQHRKK